MSDLRALSAMHYWPASTECLPPIACGAEGGFRTSDRGKVTCPACREVLSATRAPLDDRRQRAREAFYDGSNSTDVHPVDLDAAIETATRVRVTPEIMQAARRASSIILTRDAIVAAFRAAGFEVEE